MINISPIFLRQIKSFKRIKRGYYAFLLFCSCILLSFLAELFINSRALIVRYEGQFYFPTYGSYLPGTTFGLDYTHETNYRELKAKFKEENSGNFVLMPIVPYNAFENNFEEGSYPPYPPSFEQQHYLGTDTSGRDIVARLVYGFRIAILFALTLLFCNYTLGIFLGSIMGYYGGKLDLFFQRILEIWYNIPFLFVIIIVASIITPTFFTLIAIMMLFGWITMTTQIRTQTYKHKAREFVSAAKSLGARDSRIILKHILPNCVSVIVTYAPFSVSSAIVTLTALDYLGFGLPAPTPSWGELLAQGTTYISSQWILLSVIAAMVCVLVMVTFIGEAVREAFDPKQHTTYE